jgi:hypothetical protein
MKRSFITVVSLVLAMPFYAVAQASHEGPEDFRLELTGAAWLAGPTGSIRANGTPIDFVHDLNAGSLNPNFYGRLVLKPGRKHLIVLEGSPVSFSGVNNIERSFVYAGHTYNISQTVDTNASVNFAFAGYQYEPIIGRMGHLGFQAGAAYVGVNGTLAGVQSGVTESKALHGVLPLMGTEFRLFPIPGNKLLEVEGLLRGLPAGHYGYYVEGSASGGVRVGLFSFLAGYREMFANLHETNADADALILRLKGPILSAQWRW